MYIFTKNEFESGKDIKKDPVQKAKPEKKILIVNKANEMAMLKMQAK